MEIFSIGCDYEIWLEYQIKCFLQVELRSHPSLLLTGASGSGKSYALKYLLGKLPENCVNLTFCNFKRSEDFQFLNASGYYYTFTGCGRGLEEFYRKFKETQESDTEFSGTYHILVFDEFPAFLLFTAAQDKKLAESYKVMVAEMLMLGRSYGFGCWLIMQRPDASYFASGARDNFQITISLGNLSREARTMLYSGEELPQRVYQAGEGICWIDGTGIKEVKFPKILDMDAWEAKILNRLRERP